uniref:BED-type domain-containing protein n=1 Tax=Cajanus cajan TaxID=3821 RepID=A0A151SFX3_CAJCA|nr:hypothetical protein KK1_024280 [Cajanus cajan]
METSKTPSSQKGSTQNSFQKNVRRKTNIAWGHCKLLKENEKSVMLCIYYGKVIRGDEINTFKSHLPGEKGQVE